MTSSGTQKPSDEEVEADPQPQAEPKPSVPEEDDPAVEETEEQPT